MNHRKYIFIKRKNRPPSPLSLFFLYSHREKDNVSFSYVKIFYIFFYTFYNNYFNE